MGVEEPVQVGIRMYQLRMRIDERAGARPEGGKGASIVENVHVETVLHIVVAHEAEDVVVNVAEVVYLRESMSVRILYLEPHSHTSGSTRQYQSKSLSRGCL